jgi:hypothetical protein
MIARGLARNARRSATEAICVLLAVATLVLGIANLAPSHSHVSSTAGLYNAECPLAELGAHQRLVSLPSAPHSIWIGLAPAGTLFVVGDSFSASVLFTAPFRAPPLA